MCVSVDGYVYCIKIIRSKEKSLDEQFHQIISFNMVFREMWLKSANVHLNASFADNSHTFVGVVKNHQRVNEPLRNVETMNERNPKTKST